MTLEAIGSKPLLNIVRFELLNSGIEKGSAQPRAVSDRLLRTPDLMRFWDLRNAKEESVKGTCVSEHLLAEVFFYLFTRQVATKKEMERTMATYNVQRILDKLKPNEKDELYKTLWFDHIKKDTIVFASSNHININAQLADAVAKNLVFQSEYDFDKSYWDNIKSQLCKN